MEQAERSRTRGRTVCETATEGTRWRERPSHVLSAAGHAGWLAIPSSAAEVRRLGLDLGKLEKTFEYIQDSTKHGGLLVARHGWLVYEKYFGRGQREATPNTASC